MTDTKDTNPKDALAGDRIPLHIVSVGFVRAVALALWEGLCKYGRANYRAGGVRASVYVTAAMGHLGEWNEGRDIDPDSGLPELYKAAACLYILIDAQLAGVLIDDRSFNGHGVLAAKADMQAHVTRIHAMHLDKNPRHFTIADNAQPAGEVGGFA